jgi:hypothetical protein
MTVVDEFDADSSASGGQRDRPVRSEPHVHSEREADKSDISGSDGLRDTELQSEIELVSDLVVAASTSEGDLSAAEIDRILGLTGS